MLVGSENGLQAADGPFPWPWTRDDVRSTTRKLVVPRSARRLASSGAPRPRRCDLTAPRTAYRSAPATGGPAEISAARSSSMSYERGLDYPKIGENGRPVLSNVSEAKKFSSPQRETRSQTFEPSIFCSGG